MSEIDPYFFNPKRICGMQDFGAAARLRGSARSSADEVERDAGRLGVVCLHRFWVSRNFNSAHSRGYTCQNVVEHTHVGQETSIATATTAVNVSGSRICGDRRLSIVQFHVLASSTPSKRRRHTEYVVTSPPISESRHLPPVQLFGPRARGNSR